jgi:hypothetical protein
MIASEGPKPGRQHWFRKRDGGGSGKSTQCSEFSTAESYVAGWIAILLVLLFDHVLQIVI